MAAAPPEGERCLPSSFFQTWISKGEYDESCPLPSIVFFELTCSRCFLKNFRVGTVRLLHHEHPRHASHKKKQRRLERLTVQQQKYTPHVARCLRPLLVQATRLPARATHTAMASVCRSLGHVTEQIVRWFRSNTISTASRARTEVLARSLPHSQTIQNPKNECIHSIFDDVAFRAAEI